MTQSTKIDRVQRILILSNDVFASNWIAQLIIRDWRTKVVAEIGTFEELKQLISELSTNLFDIIILDADNFDANPFSIVELLQLEYPFVKIILLGKNVNTELLELINHPLIGAYLIKREVEVSLAWATVKTAQGFLVLSKEVERFALNNPPIVKKACIVLDHIEAAEYLTPSENRNAHLAFVLSMARGNLADELSLTPKSSWTLISNLYNHIGMNDLLEGDDWIQFNIEEDAIILSHLEKESCEKYKTNNHTAKETLAYHIYTKPKMRFYAR